MRRETWQWSTKWSNDAALGRHVLESILFPLLNLEKLKWPFVLVLVFDTPGRWCSAVSLPAVSLSR